MSYLLPAALASIASPNPAAHASAWEVAYRARTHWSDGPSKYQPATFPDDQPGTFFSGTFSDHVVLQRAPQAASVNGVVIGATAGTEVTVTVSSADAADATSASGSYAVKAKVEMVSKQTKSGGYARWRAVLKPQPAGGNFTVTAACSQCAAPANSSKLSDVTFGDVWVCSGQSNMWLPMHMDTSRNVTYDAILAGKYKNIRMWSVPHNNQPDGGFNGTDLDVLPPPPPRSAWGGDAGGGWLLADVGTYANATCRAGGGDHGCPDPSHCCTGYTEPNDDWLFNSIDQFSAACWHFAEHLTDLMEAKNESIVPFGLISTQWGGTMVEMWQPNASLSGGACRNSSGGSYAPWQNGRWDIDSGALWNGMVRPLTSTTIKGALWYQGENNVFQCHDAGDGAQSHGGAGGGPAACGSVKDGTGYACMMANLVAEWRKAWSVEPGTTDATFPFGIVTLAGGTSEGHAQNMGAFRWAQAGSQGFLPSAEMPNTFSAVAYDAGDPCSGGNQCCVNSKDGQGGWPCMSGEAPYTGQFMGGIHPRVKKVVGTRLAKAARAHVYGDNEVVWTGPVLSGCALDGGSLRLQFDREKLKSDTIMVLPETARSIALVDASGASWDATTLALLARLGPQSPLEVQLNGGGAADMTDGVWVPLRLNTKCNPAGTDQVQPGQAMCSLDPATGAKQDGWDEVIAPLDGLGGLLQNVTGVRYAWGENPCCPAFNRQVVPCPPNSCPIQTYNSTMPAVPFWATIDRGTGKCDWISTEGSSRPFVPPHTAAMVEAA